MEAPVMDDIHKFHKTRFVKTANEKKTQNIIVRFKYNYARYVCMER